MITSLSDGREGISLSQSGGRDTASGKENRTEDGARSYKSNDERLSCANWKSLNLNFQYLPKYTDSEFMI